MTARPYSIGDLGRLAHCKVQTIRWYEEVGLLPAPARTAGGHRQYDLVELESLRRALLETHNISSAIEVARQRGEGPIEDKVIRDA